MGISNFIGTSNSMTISSNTSRKAFLHKSFLPLLTAALMLLSPYLPLQGALRAQAAAPPRYTSFEGVTVEDVDTVMTVSCSSSLLVRGGPGKEYAQIGSVQDGTQLHVTGLCSNGWHRIDYQGGDGYVSGSYLTAASSGGEPDDSEDGGSLSEDEVLAAGQVGSFRDWFFTLSSTSLLKMLIPSVIILALAISALHLLRSIRRDRQEEYPEEDAPEEEYDEPPRSRHVMEKQTPLPDIYRPPVGEQIDRNLLDSQIRNYVVGDVERFLEEDESGEDEELIRLEQELEEKQEEVRQLQLQIARKKRAGKP